MVVRSTQTRALALLASGFLACVLTACAAEQGQKTDAPVQDTQVESFEARPLSGYMSGRWASYDVFCEDIERGETDGWRLTLYEGDRTIGYTDDIDLVLSFWERLSQVGITFEGEAEATGELTSFSFDSGREVIPFRFYGYEATGATADDPVRVVDPGEVEDIVRDLKGELHHYDEGLEPDEVARVDGSWLWDADADGEPEHVWVDFCDNGDEAPSAMRVSILGTSCEGWIERAYGIEDVRQGTDDEGPYLVFTYRQGDYYNHDALARCRVRLIGDELKITPVEDDQA